MRASSRGRAADARAAARRSSCAAGGVGIYGDRGDEVLTEESALGAGFPAEVGTGLGSRRRARAGSRVIRVVSFRQGIVLSREGGALARMLDARSSSASGAGSAAAGSGGPGSPSTTRSPRTASCSSNDVAGPVNLDLAEPRHQRPVRARRSGKALGRPTVFPVPATRDQDSRSARWARPCSSRASARYPRASSTRASSSRSLTSALRWNAPSGASRHRVSDLVTLGWDDRWSADFAEHRAAGLVPGRVVVQHRGAYDVLTEAGETRAARPVARGGISSPPPICPSSGWVALEAGGGGGSGRSGGGDPAIRAVLPRRTKFSRLAAHDPGSDATREQVVAANVDVVFLVASIVDDLSRRRLERFLTLAWESGARPVILLTKVDLEPESGAGDRRRSEVAGEGVRSHTVSVRTGAGLDDVRSYLTPGVTTALLGPSGVGKSTLVNALAGEDVMTTGEVREDGAGATRPLDASSSSSLAAGSSSTTRVCGPPALARDRRPRGGVRGRRGARGEVPLLGLPPRRRARVRDPGALADGTLDPERWRSYRELQQDSGSSRSGSRSASAPAPGEGGRARERAREATSTRRLRLPASRSS